MELAIPLVALGGLYIMSNQKNTPNTENFDNYLPNTNIPDKNYPGEYPILNVETDLTSKLSVDNKYDTPYVYTDKYFNPEVNPKITNAGTKMTYGGTNQDKQSRDAKKYYSLTGQKVGSDYFEHNNMVPFFGSNIRNNLLNADSTESIMDNLQGAGSQTIAKKEQAPLFSPQTNYQWAHGTPNMNDFYKSRVNPSMNMANVKPFSDQKVGPGLGLGFTTEGAGGYNSGMLDREAWLPKTADELRTANNPKPSGHVLWGLEGPAVSSIKNMGSQGIQEKNRPETSFEMGHDRLFTTTGLEKGSTLRSLQVDRDLNRRPDAMSYAGIAGYGNSSGYIEGEYMPSTNIELGAVPFAVANANGRNVATESDYGKKAQCAYPNNRSANAPGDYFGSVGGGIGAVVAPLLDMLRPSRRENTIGNLRPYQNAGTTVSNSYVFNPADMAPVTIRQTTEVSKNHLNVNANQNGGAYKVTKQQPIDNNRKYTSDFFYSGNSSAGERGREPRTYDAEYRQRNNDVKSSTIQGYMVKGNMSLFNGDVNMSMKDRDTDLKNRRALMPDMPYQTASIFEIGKLQGNNNGLYEGIELDRTSHEILNQLKTNPYALSNLNGL
jgi:hypothetical protein